MNRMDISRREMLIGAGVGAASAVLPAAALPRTQRMPRSSAPENVVRFGVITDVHQDIMHDGEERIRSFLGAMNETNPDFVVQLGDFCVPEERNDSFMAAWNEFPGPRHHVIGNHDTDGGHNRDEVVEYYGMPARYYSLDHSGVHFVSLDGNDRGGTSGGYPRFVADDQIRWLREDLASHDLPTVIMIHQPLDSSHGVDNRAAIRAVLEEAKKTPGHADVIAVLAGHSHLDYCRLINGIHYLMINSASYQWVGGNHRHPSYPAEIHAKAPWIEYTCPYRDPLWATIEIDPVAGTIQVDGRSSSWVGPSPRECAPDAESQPWGWDPRFSRPHISSWRVPFASTGELG